MCAGFLIVFASFLTGIVFCGGVGVGFLVVFASFLTGIVFGGGAGADAAELEGSPSRRVVWPALPSASNYFSFSVFLFGFARVLP